MADFWEQTRLEDTFVSQLWKYPGFQLRSCRVDFMHAVCLGILQYAMGNALWELYCSLGGTSTNRGPCQMLLAMIHSMARELEVEIPLNTLTYGMMKKDTSAPPKLKLKAAEGRNFLPVLCKVLSTCFSMDSEHGQLRFHCLDSLRQLYGVMDNWVDDGSSTARFRQLQQQHVLLYCQLCLEAQEDDADTLLWRLYPKHHMFCHISGADNPKAWKLRMHPRVNLTCKKRKDRKGDPIYVRVLPFLRAFDRNPNSFNPRSKQAVAKSKRNLILYAPAPILKNREVHISVPTRKASPSLISKPGGVVLSDGVRDRQGREDRVQSECAEHALRLRAALPGHFRRDLDPASIAAYIM